MEKKKFRGILNYLANGAFKYFISFLLFYYYQTVLTLIYFVKCFSTTNNCRAALHFFNETIKNKNSVYTGLYIPLSNRGADLLDRRFIEIQNEKLFLNFATLFLLYTVHTIQKLELDPLLFENAFPESRDFC